MKITLNNEEYDLPGTVITDQMQPKIDGALSTYKEWPIQKRLMVKAGIRTLFAFLEGQFGLRVEFPEGDDFIIMLLTNIPQWIQQFTERIELDATSISDLTTRHSTITGLSVKFTN